MQRNIHHHLSAEERAFALGSRVGVGWGGGEYSWLFQCQHVYTRDRGCQKRATVENPPHGAPPPHPTPPHPRPPPTTGCECGRLGGLLSDCGLPPRAVDHADARGRLRPHVCGRHPARVRRTALGAHGAGVLATGKKNTKKRAKTQKHKQLSQTLKKRSRSTRNKHRKLQPTHPPPTLSLPS